MLFSCKECGATTTRHRDSCQVIESDTGGLYLSTIRLFRNFLVHNAYEPIFLEDMKSYIFDPWGIAALKKNLTKEEFEKLQQYIILM